MPNTTKPTPIAVQGILNFAEADDCPDAAVIVNPEASPRALVAWGEGQVDTTLRLLMAVEQAGGEADAAEVATAAATLLEQAQVVLRAAVAAMPEPHDAEDDLPEPAMPEPERPPARPRKRR